MIDPLERWARYGEKPDYAGLLTFAGQPYTQDPAELKGFDVAIVGAGPVFLTVDVDVLDAAFIPGTGTPEPGGMTPTDLLLSVRTLAAELELIGMDVVEVIPTGVGSADVSALVAERTVREALTGVALRRRYVTGGSSTNV